MHEPTSSHLIANLGMAKAAYPSHAVVWVYLSTSFPNRILAPRRGDPRIRPDCQSKRNFFRHGRARPVGRLFWWLARSNKVRVMHTKKKILLLNTSTSSVLKEGNRLQMPTVVLVAGKYGELSSLVFAFQSSRLELGTRFKWETCYFVCPAFGLRNTSRMFSSWPPPQCYIG